MPVELSMMSAVEVWASMSQHLCMLRLFSCSQFLPLHPQRVMELDRMVIESLPSPTIPNLDWPLTLAAAPVLGPPPSWEPPLHPSVSAFDELLYR